MHFPVKLNVNRLPSWLRSTLPCRDDPRKLNTRNLNVEEFENCVAAIKIDTTWKSTSKKRHVITDKLISSLLTKLSRPTLLEIGVSAGSTSLELLDSIRDNFDKYYVTDLTFHIKGVEHRDATYFYHPVSHTCIMRVSDYFVVYDDVEGAIFPFGLVSSRVLEAAPRLDSNVLITVDLLHPELRRRASLDARIVVEEYSVFDPWPNERVDVIKVANVLNRAYFSDTAILDALVNLRNALSSGGTLVITDNRQVEMVTMYSKNQAGNLIVDRAVNGGTEIADLVERSSEIES